MVAASRVRALRRALGQPLATGGLVPTLGSSALENARQALTTVAQQVLDRRALAPADPDSPLSAGDLASLPRDECLELLRSKRIGRFAYVARAGVPDIAPVNYVMSGSDVLVRSGPGPKLQAAERRELVAFEVDDLDEQTASGWSIVLVGRAQRLTLAQLRGIAEDELPRSWANGPRHSVVRIRPTRITGRRLG